MIIRQLLLAQYISREYLEGKKVVRVEVIGSSRVRLVFEDKDSTVVTGLMASALQKR